MVSSGATDRAWTLLEQVCDPELPMLSVLDLGVVRRVACPHGDTSRVEVDVTPTYSGCPAIDTILGDIRSTLEREYEDVVVSTVLAPAWTSDWISEQGKAKLAEHGIAPPQPVRTQAHATRTMTSLLAVVEPAASATCPRCGSAHTTQISEFGSTACKALWRCESCSEPFDQFKAH